MEISLTGFFSFQSDEDISDETKCHLVNVNAVSILMPYLRSQISLVTAQPEMDCVVLPPFNINNMLQSQDEE
jgi:preprotein translocase subunit SecB